MASDPAMEATAAAAHTSDLALHIAATVAGLPWWTITEALNAAFDRGYRAGVRATRAQARAASGPAPSLAELTRIAAIANGRRSA